MTREAMIDEAVRRGMDRYCPDWRKVVDGFGSIGIDGVAVAAQPMIRAEFRRIAAESEHA